MTIEPHRLRRQHFKEAAGEFLAEIPHMDKRRLGVLKTLEHMTDRPVLADRPFIVERAGLIRLGRGDHFIFKRREFVIRARFDLKLIDPVDMTCHAIIPVGYCCPKQALWRMEAAGASRYRKIE